jgi:hypothetical protein
MRSNTSGSVVSVESNRSRRSSSVSSRKSQYALPLVTRMFGRITACHSYVWPHYRLSLVCLAA